MTRIPGVPEGANPFVRAAYALTRRKLGRMVEPVSVAAHHPRLLLGMAAFDEAVDRSHRVDRRVKALAELQAAAHVGCPFWLDIGSAEARAAGITDEQLQALPEYRESPLFSELEKLAMDYAVQMTATPQEVSDELVEALRRNLDVGQLVELTYAIGWENFRARTNHAFGIGASGFSEGAACAVPQRAAQRAEHAEPTSRIEDRVAG